MSKVEMILAEIKAIQEEYEYLEVLEEGPCGVFSAWPTGMPRGTNDMIAALLQREDVNEKIDILEDYYKKLEKLIS